MHLTLERFCYANDYTLGRLFIGPANTHQPLATIERPWIQSATKGGRPYESCVPDGSYDLVPFTRSNGDEVVALVNKSLGVFVNEDDLDPERGGRFAILIHAGNWTKDVVGCIAPGMTHAIDENEHMVQRSRDAMKIIMDALADDSIDKLTIRPALGANDTRYRR